MSFNERGNIRGVVRIYDMWNLCVALFYEPDEVSWRARNIIHEFNKFPVISWWHVACHRRRDFLSAPLTPPLSTKSNNEHDKESFFMLLGFLIWGHNRVTWFNFTCRLPCIIKSTFLYCFFFRFSFCALQWLFRRCIILIVCICVLFSSLMSCVTIICWWQKKWCSRVSILVQCQYWQYWHNQYYTGRPNFVIVPLTLLCSVVCYAGGGREMMLTGGSIRPAAATEKRPPILHKEAWEPSAPPLWWRTLHALIICTHFH